MPAYTQTTPSWIPTSASVRRISPEAPSGADRRAFARDVRDLLLAAGPLSLRDIAGGLDAPIARVGALVNRMVARGYLRLDEWGRHRLAACIERAGAA